MREFDSGGHMTHKHDWKVAARFKWFGRWHRRYECACGAGWFR